MSKQIYLIRHAESTFNIAQQNQSQLIDLKDQDKLYLNCGLTPTGQIQAQTLAQELCHIKFDVILVSPLRRAQETWSYLNLASIPHETCSLLREYRIDICDFLEHEPLIPENLEDLDHRVNQLKTYLQSRPEITIGLITHGDFIWAMTSQLIDHDRYGQVLNNAEYYVTTIQ